MKKLNLFITVSISFLFYSLQAQENPTIPAYSSSHALEGNVPSVIMPNHDFTQDIIDADAFEKQGNYPRFARLFDVNLTMLNSGVWTEFNNGDRVWRLAFKSAGALATCLFFEDFWLPEGATIHVYSPDKKEIQGSYTYLDNQGNDLFSTEFLKGEECVIEYYESFSARGQGRFKITSLAHQYRELQMAEACQVNVRCSPEGDNWQDEKRGVVRIQVKQDGSLGWCSGSLVNNTALDCKRYILTAFHCGETSTTTDFNGWKFYFNYESTQCIGTSGVTNNVFTGCTKRADSDDGSGGLGSDFLLIQINSSSSPSWWGNGSNIYWNGWSKATTAPSSGSICIHHPAGSNKKISKTTGTATSTTWGWSGTPNAHWRVQWTGTTNGWGVTEGGSSGSPLFNTSGLIVGTLTGGNSFCNSTQNPNGQNQPDSYGKMSSHWTSNGTSSAHQLKPWLDPISSDVTTLSGAYNPCNSLSTDEKNTNVQQVTIFPNPNNGKFSINVMLEKPSDIEISVYNFIGQQIEIKKIEHTIGSAFETDLSSQTAGIYFIHVKTPLSHEIKKVIVNK